jgi:Ca-activated chloride channel homolog
MRLDFQHPIVLLLVPLSAAVVYVIWRTSRTYMPPLRHRLALVLRLTVVSLFAVALAGPVVQLRAERVAVAILLDRSDSISPAARVQQEAWLSRAFPAKSAADQVAVVSFGADATLERTLSTAIRRALDLTRKPARGQRNDGI